MMPVCSDVSLYSDFTDATDPFKLGHLSSFISVGCRIEENVLQCCCNASVQARVIKLVRFAVLKTFASSSDHQEGRLVHIVRWSCKPVTQRAHDRKRVFRSDRSGCTRGDHGSSHGKDAVGTGEMWQEMSDISVCCMNDVGCANGSMRSGNYPSTSIALNLCGWRQRVE